MQQKVSLWIEDAIAVIAFLAFAAFAPLYTFSLQQPATPRPATVVAPAVSTPQLLLPLQCDAWIVQSGDGIAEPRARCYVFPERKGK